MELSSLVYICIMSLFCTFISFIWGIHEEITRTYRKYGFKTSIIAFAIFLITLLYILYCAANGTLHTA